MATRPLVEVWSCWLYQLPQQDYILQHNQHFGRRKNTNPDLVPVFCEDTKKFPSLWTTGCCALQSERETGMPPGYSQRKFVDRCKLCDKTTVAYHPGSGSLCRHDRWQLAIWYPWACAQPDAAAPPRASRSFMQATTDSPRPLARQEHATGRDGRARRGIIA